MIVNQVTFLPYFSNQKCYDILQTERLGARQLLCQGMLFYRDLVDLVSSKTTQDIDPELD